MRKFLLVYLPLFGVLASVGLTPVNGLLLLAALPLLVIPFIANAEPAILLCSASFLLLGVALVRSRNRFSRIAAAMSLAIVSIAVLAIGPGMLGRREAVELAQRAAKDDISRAASSLPKRTDMNLATDRSPPR
jgi:hypothetical protein